MGIVHHGGFDVSDLKRGFFLTIGACLALVVLWAGVKLVEGWFASEIDEARALTAAPPASEGVQPRVAETPKDR